MNNNNNNKKEEEDNLVISIVDEDGMLDTETLLLVYKASVDMLSDIVVFLEEQGYTEKHFNDWRKAYKKRNMH